MRRPIICVSTDIVNMNTPNQQNHEASSESRMDRLRKLLSSPLSRRKSTSCPAKTFGVPLEALVEKNSPQGSVPFVVNRLCSFIVENGLKQEGLFRIGGNARLIEKLKAVIDQTGDALLETEGDVPSAASLLKLFLRELPEPVVPASLCPEFLNAVRNCGDQRQECAMRLKCLVEKMPSENFNLLKYLSQFLKEVADHKEQNRMGPLALGIVFGPNIFRFSDDMKGLKDQSVTNQVIGYFITDYYAIFEGDSELYSTKTSAVRQEKEPLTIERKSSKLSVPVDSEKPKRIATAPTSVSQSLAFEPLSIVIPPLEKYVIQEKQVPALIVDRVVEQTINQRITKHLFGEHTKEPYSVHLSHKRKRKERRTSEEEPKSSRSNSEERLLDWGPVTEDVTSIRRCSSHEEITPKESIENVQDNADQKQAKRRDVNGSKNLELPVKIENQKPQPSQHQELNDEHEARRSAERLAPFRRSPIGKIRRSPSRTLHRSLDLDSKNQTSSEEKERKCSIPDRLTSGVSVSLNDDSSFSHTDSEPCKENVHLTEGVSRKQEETHKLSTICTIHNMPGNQFIDGQFRSTFVDHLNFHGHDEIHNSHHSHHHHHKGYSEECLSHPMLELHPMENLLMGRGENDQKNGSPGENSAAKDDSSVIAFTSLYEGADGTEPVLSEHRYSWPLVRPGREDDTALSPSFHYLRKSNSLHLDPSLPPSPPVEQNIFHKSPHKRSEEAVTVKQVNKKIHTLKKKIRKFEETFESEHGFRPSHAEKMNYPEIKKLLQGLSEARKDLKYLKEEQCTDSEEGVTNFQRKTELLKEEPDYKEIEISECDNNLNKPTVEESLEVALKSLSDKRRLAQRPDDIEKMTKEQIMDEKIAIQKALLRFESIHGRPTPISDRELVRPLYDRYRTMKRLVTRYNLVGGIGGKGKDLGSELQPILEHVAMDFISPQPREEGMEEGKDTALSTEKLVLPDSKPQTQMKFLSVLIL
ncbi:protein FAM13A-like isoform X2 [Tachypleus tridentatus]|uniref:protein FAM13A-like isoform X2 n=1 Tax=Tachypleus tridentatus TaxID=6853 RepID=UPI003FD07B36